MSDAAADPTSRRTLLVRQLMARRGQDDEMEVYADEQSESAERASGSERSERHASSTAEQSDPDPAARRLRYGDRRLTLFPDATERDRLDALLDEYPVFKLDAPATRKADEAVYVSAVADPKHLADFIEDCCRRVYGLPESYRLRIE